MTKMNKTMNEPKPIPTVISPDSDYYRKQEIAIREGRCVSEIQASERAESARIAYFPVKASEFAQKERELDKLKGQLESERQQQRPPGYPVCRASLRVEGDRQHAADAGC